MKKKQQVATEPRKRQMKILGETVYVGIFLPVVLDNFIQAEAARQMSNKTTIIRQVLAEYVMQQGGFDAESTTQTQQA